MKLPVVNDKGSVSWTPVIGKKIFHRGLFEKIKFKNFDFQNQKYLTSKKYLEDLIRCKIKFWTTFVFCAKLIFQLPFELWSFEISKKYFVQKYLASKWSNWWRAQRVSMVSTMFYHAWTIKKWSQLNMDIEVIY